jgi:hypothetical protein
MPDYEEPLPQDQMMEPELQEPKPAPEPAPYQEPEPPEKRAGRLDGIIALHRQQDAATLRDVFRAVADVDPAQAANLDAAAKALGVDPRTLPADPDVVKRLLREQRLKELNFEQFTPALTAHLKEIPNARLWHDDLGNLQETQGHFDWFWKGTEAGQVTNEEGFLFAKRAWARMHNTKLTPQEEDRITEIQDITRMSDLQATGLLDAFAKTLGQLVEPALASVAAGAALAYPTLAGGPISGGVAFTTGALSAAFAYSAVVEFGHQYEETYNKLTAAGVPADQAHEAALETGIGYAIAAGFVEVGGTAVLGKPFVSATKIALGLTKPTIAGAWKRLAKETVSGLLVEPWEEGVQQFESAIAENLAAKQTGTDIGPTLSQAVSEAGQAAWAAAKGMILIAPLGPALHFTADLNRAHQARAAVELADRVAESMSKSEVLKRNPDAVAAAVQAAAGPTDAYYIEGPKLAQGLVKSGQTREQLGRDLPDVLRQLTIAEKTGDDVMIPMGDFAAKIAPTDLFPAIRESIRLKNGWSLDRADEWFAERDANAKATQQMVAEASAKVVDWDKQALAVQDRFRVELRNDPRLTTEQVGYYSLLYRQNVEIMAAREGKTPAEWDAKNGLKVRLGAPTGETLPQFAGMQSKTANLFDFSKAQQMLAEGKDAETIRNKTGWFKGADGEWRYEISDRDAKWIGPTDTASTVAAFAKKRGVSTREAMRRFSPRELTTLTVGDVLEHPTLFEAYPSLRDMPVMLFRSSSSTMGFTSNIGIGVNLNASESPDDILLHELQHVIQEVEGFALGGNTNQFTAADLEKIKQADFERVLTEIKKTDPAAVDDFERYMEVRKRWSDLQAQDGASEEATAAAAKEATQLFNGMSPNVQRLVLAKISTLRPFAAYERLAGEVEARNTVLRRKLTYKQRESKKQSPFTTADTPLEKLLIQFERPKREVDPGTFRQTRTEDEEWADYEPLRTKEGKIRGAPEWVKTDSDLKSLRAQLRSRIEEGEVGRYWYEESTRMVLEVTGGNVLDAEKLIQLIAIYSPNNEIWVNLIMAVRSYSHWKNGGTRETLKSGMPALDEKAQALLYEGKSWGGRKTNNFYLNLMHEIVHTQPQAEVAKLNLDPDLLERINKAVTADVWMYRVFGYENEQGGEGKGGDKYSFVEGETRRLIARKNLAGAPVRWLPHQGQAAMWTGMKTRYEMQKVMEQTNAKSLRDGLITYETDKKGKRVAVYPTTPDDQRAHFANWRHFALQPTIAETKAAAETSARSFADDLAAMSQTVTWETVPAPTFAHPINAASPEVRQQFTGEAVRLILGDDSHDLIAARLGVVLGFGTAAQGSFEGKISPNWLSHLLAPKQIGQDFSVKEVRLYTRIVQYIFKQKAVPWIRPDNRVLSDSGEKAQRFKVVNKTGKTLRTFDTQKDAETYAAQAPEERSVRGGQMALGVLFRFAQDPDATAVDTFYQALKQHVGPMTEFTRMGSNEFLVVNFRDDTTRVPFAQTDETFLAGVTALAKTSSTLGLASHGAIYVDGEYGQEHDWAADPQGGTLLSAPALSGRPDLQAWLRDRRDAFEQLLAGYDARGIKEAQAAIDARQAAVEQRAAAEREAQLAEKQREQAKQGLLGPEAQTQALAEEAQRAAIEAGPGQRLAQTGAERPRGEFEIKTKTVWLNPNADASTVLHEMSHYWLRMLFETASQATASEQTKADAQTVLDWFGVKDIETWNKMSFAEQKQHDEAWAYNAEKHFFGEGLGPGVNEDQRRMFRVFGRWIRQVYRGVLNVLNVNYKQEHGVDLPGLTPQVRDVFNRMVASEDAIEAAKTERAMAPMLREKPADMSDEDWANYVLESIDSSAVATDELQRASLQAMKWGRDNSATMAKKVQRYTRTIRKKVEAEERAKVETEPVYLAEQRLRHGVLDDNGTARPFKLNLTEFRNLSWVGDKTTEELEQKFGTGPSGMLALNGLPLDSAAQMLGFPSGETLVKALTAAPPKEEVVQQRTDTRMAAEHSELTDPAKVKLLVEKALHNQVRTKMVAAELKWLRKITAPIQLMIRAAREHARNVLGIQPVGLVRPHEHAQAEVRARREAERFLIKGDHAMAAAQKRRELIEGQMEREAIEVQETIEEARELVRKLFRSDAKLAASRDVDYVAVARYLAATFTLAPGDRAPGDYIRQLQAYNPALAEKLQPQIELAQKWAANALADGRTVNTWRDLTVDEFRDLFDAIKALWNMSLREEQFATERGNKALADVAGEVVAQHAKSGPKEVKPVTAVGRAWNSLKQLIYRPEHWAYRRDGAQVGAFTRYFWRPIRDAVDRYVTKRNEFTRRIADRVKELRSQMKLGQIEFRDRKGELLHVFGKDNGGFGEAELVAALLHTGNFGNLRRLIVGRKWGAYDVDSETLDTREWDAFTKRMRDEGRLTKASYDFVQWVWDLNEEIKPLAQKAHHDLSGFYFKEVEAVPVATPWGTYRGGYMPAKLDENAASANRIQSLADLEKDFRKQFASTGKGFTKDRAENFAEPLMLNLDMVPAHVDDVLRFSILQPVIRDIERLAKHGDVATVLEGTQPGVWNNMLLPWLQRVASQSITRAGKNKTIDAFWRSARSNAGISMMFANVGNALQQLTGVFVAALKVKPRYLFRGMWRFLTERGDLFQSIADKSGFMSNRQKNQVFDSLERIQELSTNPSKFAKFKKWSRQHGYFLQTWLQNMVDTVVWTGAYEQANEQSARSITDENTEAEAIKQADAAVRMTQSSFDPTDVAQYEEGTPFYRIWTMFSGYFNTLANLQADQLVRMGNEMGFGKAGVAFQMYLLGFMAPMLLAEAITRTTRGQWDDDDGDGDVDVLTLDFLFLSQLRSLAAELPVFGTGANSALSMLDNQPWNDRMTSSPAITALEKAFGGTARGARRAMGLQVDKKGNVRGPEGEDLRDVLTLLGIIFGVPVGALGARAGYAADVASGAVQARSGADFIRGLISGAASRQAR